MNDDKQQKQKSEWKTVTYGDKEMLDWYRGYLKRRELGLENEFYDIFDEGDSISESNLDSAINKDGQDKSA